MARSMIEALDDEHVIAHVRYRVEKVRTFAEAYGQRMSTDEYVRHTLHALGEALNDEHHT